MATHSSVLAWRTPGTGEPSGRPSMASHRIRHNWSDLAAAAWAKNGFPILNLLNKTVKRRIMLHDMWKLDDAWISVSINKALLAPSHPHLFPYCLWLLLRYNGRVGVVEMEIQMEWSTKSHICPITSYPGKLCRLLIKRIEFQWLKANLSYLGLH